MTEHVFGNRFLIFRALPRKIGALARRFVTLFSTFGEFIFNPIDRRDKSFLSTPFQEPEAAGIVEARGVGKRDHRVDPGRGHQEPRTTILAGSGRARFSSFWHRSKSVLRAAGSASEIVSTARYGRRPQPPQAGLGDTEDVDAGLRVSRLHSPPPGDPEIEEYERVDDRQLPAVESSALE
jgi:hypothetical protein